MSKFPTHPGRPAKTRAVQSAMIESLEPRIAPAVTPLAVARALDLSEGTTVTLSGNVLSFGTMKMGASGQLLGFPSGSDGDFLILSTGVATQLTSTANVSDRQGTDLGAVGADGDSASVSFVLDVPQHSAGSQRFKLDFMFLTDEFPELRGQTFNDVFTVIINGTNYAVDGNGNLMEVDNGFFTGKPAEGTYFDGRSDKLTLTYAVPLGVTQLQVELKIADVGDGKVDSAVLVDNVRFERRETVFVDFDGGRVENLFGAGIVADVPGFKPSDIGSSLELDALIANILAALEQKFAAYDISFTATAPVYGDYATIFLGGNNSLMLDLAGANPLLQQRFPTQQASVGSLYGLGNDALLGLAGPPDVGNLNSRDQAVIFSGEFAGFFTGASQGELFDHLVVTIAHELGHNLGLRHVTDDNPDDIMSETAPRSSGAVFANSLLPLAEQWSDGAIDQNAHQYLLSVLGSSQSSGTGIQVAAIAGITTFFPRLAETLYNATVEIRTGDSEVAAYTLHFQKLDGTQSVSLPLLPANAKISIWGASNAGGPIDTFSGSPVDGGLTESAQSVPLYDFSGKLASVAIAKLGGDGKFKAAAAANLLAHSMGDATLATGKTLTFTDIDGDLYTIRLTGPGTMSYVLNDPDLNGQGALTRLMLEGTSFTSSSIAVTVQKRGPNGDGRVEISEVFSTPGAGLKSFSAPMADFVGAGIVMGGALGAITIGDLENGADVIATSWLNGKTTFKAHAIGNGSEISIGTEVTTMQAAWIGDAAISVQKLGSLVITGDVKAGLARDFRAQLQVIGALGSLKVGDVLSGASISAGGNALDKTILAMRSVADGVTVALASAVTSLSATAVGDAAFTAAEFVSVNVTGAFEGDIVSKGKLGRFVAKDLASTASITAGGLSVEYSTISVGVIADGVSIQTSSSLSLLKAVDIGQASITAASIRTLDVTGRVQSGIKGNFEATLTLSGGNADFINQVTTFRVAGAVSGATINVQSIGSFSAFAVTDSTILAAYTPYVSGAPLDGGVFFEGGEIKSFTVRGGGPGLSNSLIAAKTIGSIKVTAVETDNGGAAFGFLLDEAPGKVSIKDFVYDPAGPAEQVSGDFRIKVV